MIPTPETDALNTALAGRYAVERELGRGGMGIVLLARDLALDRSVAIKLLPPALAAQSDLRERFLREVRTAASLSHPNIVPIYAVEDTGSLVFYVMGYIDGETLTQRVRRAGPLAATDAARMLQECAWGLGYAHGRGIVHRDVKADNILVERGSGRAYVTDFGIARVANSATMTAIGETLGTPQYMSPEQAAGEPLDGRSDLYSLGIVAFFALTGTVPFDAPSVQAILAMQITKAAPPMATVRAGIPSKLAEAIDRCLAKDAADRFPTGEAFVAAIQDAQTTRPEIAPPVRMFQRMAEMGMAQLLTTSFLLVFLAGTAARSPWMLPVAWCTMIIVLMAQLRARALGMLAQGYGYDDVVAAFEDEARQRREGAASTAPVGITRLGVGVVARVVGGLAIAATGLAIGIPSHHGSWQNALGRILLVVGLLTAMLSIILRLARARVGVGTRGVVWSRRLWLGPFGRAFFRAVEGREMRGGSRPPASGAGMRAAPSVSGLISALSPKDRRELGEAQRAITQLEQQIRAIAQREEQIDAAIGEAERTVATLDHAPHPAGRAALMKDLTNARATLGLHKEKRLGALEEFRVGLVRVRAGIGQAADLGPTVERSRALLADPQ